MTLALLMRPALSTIVLLLLATYISGQKVKVTHVSDGDSFIVAGGRRVRMIGVDAPELADNFGRESKEHLANLIRGKTVTLERDPLNQDRDRYWRLLRFVSLDRTDINRQMIADGYARALLRYPFARERQDAYRDAETLAKADRLGLWAVSSNGNVHATGTPPAPVESNRATEPSPAWPKSCSGAFVLLLLTAYGFTRRACP